MKAFPLNGLVPYEGDLFRIREMAAGDPTPTYLLVRAMAGMPAVVRAKVSHERIAQEIASYAKFNIGDETYIDRRFITFPIVQRKWSFKLGTVMYGVTDRKRRVILVWKRQETLIDAARMQMQAPDNLPAGSPPGYLDPDLVS